MRFIAAIPENTSTITEKSGGSRKKVVGGKDSQRCGPLVSDQYINEKVFLNPGEDKSVDLTPLELTTGLMMASNGIFRSKLHLLDQSKDHDDQSLTDATTEWVTDNDGTAVSPYFYHSKQSAILQNEQYRNWAEIVLDGNKVPNIMRHSNVRIDFNQLTKNWADPPKSGIIRLAAILGDRESDRFDIELYAQPVEDLNTRSFKIYSQAEADAEGKTPAELTAESFSKVFDFWTPLDLWTDLDKPKLLDKVVSNGSVIIWSKVVRPQQDVERVYGQSSHNILYIDFSGTINDGDYFTLNIPSLALDKVIPGTWPVKFTAVTGTPNVKDGEFAIGIDATETRDNFHRTFDYMRGIIENHPADLPEDKDENRLPIDPDGPADTFNTYKWLAFLSKPVLGISSTSTAIKIISSYKGIDWRYDVDSGEKKDLFEAGSANGTELPWIKPWATDPWRVSMPVRDWKEGSIQSRKPFLVGDELTIEFGSSVTVQEWDGSFLTTRSDSEQLKDSLSGSFKIKKAFIDQAFGSDAEDIIIQLDRNKPGVNKEIYYLKDEDKSSLSPGDLVIIRNDENDSIIRVAVKSFSEKHSKDWSTNTFTGVNMEGATFRQEIGPTGPSYYEGDIIVGIEDFFLGVTELSEENWTHPKHHYNARDYINYGIEPTPASEDESWETYRNTNLATSVDMINFRKRTDVPRWGIRDIKDGKIPRPDSSFLPNGDKRLDLTEENDPAKNWYFKPNSDYIINHTVENFPSLPPYPGRHLSGRGVEVNLGRPENIIETNHGVTGVGGFATGLYLAPHSGSTIYKTKDNISGAQRISRWESAYQFVNFFIEPSTFFPAWVNVPIGTDMEKNINNLLASIRRRYSKFRFEIGSIPEFGLYNVILYNNDPTLTFNTSSFSPDYTFPLHSGNVNEAGGMQIRNKHIVGVTLHNPNEVDITINLVAMGQRKHPSKSVATQNSW